MASVRPLWVVVCWLLPLVLQTCPCQLNKNANTAPLDRTSGPTPQDTLQQRWDLACTGSQNPAHTKVEKICSHCHSHHLRLVDFCRGCRASMATCYNMIPGTWPPLGVPEKVLQLYEPAASVAATQLDATTSTVPDVEMQEAHEAEGPNSPGFGTLSVTQLKSEATRLECLLSDLDSSEGFRPIRDQAEQTLLSSKKELSTRKGPGQNSRALAEKHLSDAEVLRLKDTISEQDRAQGSSTTPLPLNHSVIAGICSGAAASWPPSGSTADCHDHIRHETSHASAFATGWCHCSRQQTWGATSPPHPPLPQPALQVESAGPAPKRTTPLSAAQLPQPAAPLPSAIANRLLSPETQPNKDSTPEPPPDRQNSRSPRHRASPSPARSAQGSVSTTKPFPTPQDPPRCGHGSPTESRVLVTALVLAGRALC